MIKNSKDFTFDKITELCQSSIHDVFTIITEAKTYYPERNVKAIKPKLNQTHTAAEVEVYLNALKIWESESEKRIAQQQEYINEVNRIDGLIIDFIKTQSGLFNLSEKMQERIWAKAWDEGHSYGYTEVYNKLIEFVDLCSD